MPYKNKEDMKAYNKRNYEKNKEKFQARNREKYRIWCLAHPGERYSQRERRTVRTKMSSEEFTLYVRSTNLKRNYNMTLQDYELLHNQQDGLCAICSKPETSLTPTGQIKPLAVDHCHVSGKIRGLLCIKCNAALGALNDSIELLHNAIKYLERMGFTNE